MAPARLGFGVSFVALLLAACGGGGGGSVPISIAIKTDMQPVTEFDTVRVLLEPSSGSDRDVSYTPGAGDDFARRVQVTRFKSVPRGTATLTIALELAGHPVATKTAEIKVTTESVVLINVERPVLGDGGLDGAMGDSGQADAAQDAAADAPPDSSMDAAVDSSMDAAVDATPDGEVSPLPGFDHVTIDPTNEQQVRAFAVASPMGAAAIITMKRWNSTGIPAMSGCPAVNTVGDTKTYTAGCSGGDYTWPVGTRVEVGDFTALANYTSPLSTLHGTITNTNFGFTHAVNCSGNDINVDQSTNGTATFTQNGSGGVDFHVDMTFVDEAVDLDDCSVYDRGGRILYDGTVTGTYALPSTWTGSGYYGVTNEGYVSASTTDEYYSDMCTSEAWTGSTMLTAANGTMEVIYRGSTTTGACNTNTEGVQWKWNGVSKGILAGITCSALVPGVGGRVPTAWVILGAALAIAMRRSLRARRESRPRPEETD